MTRAKFPCGLIPGTMFPRGGLNRPPLESAGVQVRSVFSVLFIYLFLSATKDGIIFDK